MKIIDSSTVAAEVMRTTERTTDTVVFYENDGAANFRPFTVGELSRFAQWINANFASDATIQMSNQIGTPWYIWTGGERTVEKVPS